MEVDIGISFQAERGFMLPPEQNSTSFNPLENFGRKWQVG
jgi:hypothetical protein